MADGTWLNNEALERWYRMRMRAWWRNWRWMVWILIAVIWLAALVACWESLDQYIFFLHSRQHIAFGQPVIYTYRLPLWTPAVTSFITAMGVPAMLAVAASQALGLRLPPEVAITMSSRETWWFRIATARKCVWRALVTVGSGSLFMVIFTYIWYLLLTITYARITPAAQAAAGSGVYDLPGHIVSSVYFLLCCCGCLAVALEWIAALLSRIERSLTGYLLLAAPVVCLLVSAVWLTFSNSTSPGPFSGRNAWEPPVLAGAGLAALALGMLGARWLWRWAAQSLSNSRWLSVIAVALAASMQPLWNDIDNGRWLWPVGALCRGLYVGNVWQGSGAWQWESGAPAQVSVQALGSHSILGASLASTGAVIYPDFFVPWYAFLAWVVCYYAYSLWVVRTAANRMPHGFM